MPRMDLVALPGLELLLELPILSALLSFSHLLQQVVGGLPKEGFDIQLLRLG